MRGAGGRYLPVSEFSGLLQIPAHELTVLEGTAVTQSRWQNSLALGKMWVVWRPRGQLLPLQLAPWKWVWPALSTPILPSAPWASGGHPHAHLEIPGPLGWVQIACWPQLPASPRRPRLCPSLLRPSQVLRHMVMAHGAPLRPWPPQSHTYRLPVQWQSVKPRPVEDAVTISHLSMPSPWPLPGATSAKHCLDPG